MSDDVSARIIDQRIRNRIIEAVEWLSEGDNAVREMGSREFFEGFYDWVDDERTSWPWPGSAPDTMTPEEIEAVTDVLTIVNTANEAALKLVTEEEFVASGWPEQIAPIAKKSLDLFLLRGRFDEEREETEPMQERQSPLP